MSQQVFNEVTLTPNTVSAGESIDFHIMLVIGPDYTSGDSRIVFDFPTTVGMSRPTRWHFEDFGFTNVYVNNAHVRYKLNMWDLETGDHVAPGKPRSWRDTAARMAVLDLDGGLQPGDRIELVWGDTSGGYGPGTHVTHVVPRPDYASIIHVRYFDSQEKGLPDFGRSFTGYDRPVPDAEIALPFTIKPCSPHHLRLIRQHDRALLVPYDRFWNTAQVSMASELIKGPEPANQTPSGTFVYTDPTITVESRNLSITQSPPMHDVYDGYNLYWGDVHNHSAVSVDCVEREKMDMYADDLMTFARERSGLDFYAVSDHHEPHHHPRNHISREDWQRLLDAIEKQHQPGQFVVFPAYEFRDPRGDTAIILNWMATYEEIFHPEWTDIRDLWATYAGKDYLTIPHFHNPGSLEDGMWWTTDAFIEPVLEIYSCHGSYERPDALEQEVPLIKSRRPDRYGSWFLEHGYRYGLVANSDGHKGHVGTNGVTAVFARELTRDAIFEAYRARRVYGTTNARMRLIFTGNGHLMGAQLPNSDEKTFMIDVIGENRLKKVDLFRNGQLYQRFVPDGITFKTEVTVTEDTPSYWYVRATQIDNHIAYASPIWFGEPAK